MKRTWEAGVIRWPGVGGGPDNLDLTGIPDGVGEDSYRVACLQLRLELVFNTAVTTGALDGIEMYEFLKKITLKSMGKQLVNISGPNLFQFIQFSAIDTLDVPLDAADNLTAEVRVLKLFIPFEGKKSAEAQDFVLPAAALNGGILKIDMEDATTIGTDTTITAATIYVSALLERKEEVQIPSLPEIVDGNLEMDNGHLPSGQYDVLFMVKPSDDYAVGDLTSIGLVADGEDIHNAVDPDVVLGMYGWDSAIPLDGFLGATGTAQDWKTGAANINIFPLIWPASNESSNRITQMVDTRGDVLVFKMKGDLVTIEYVARRFRAIDYENKKKVLGAMGVPKPSAVLVKLKTKSKKLFSEVKGKKHLQRYGALAIPQKVIGASGESVINLGRLNVRLGVN